MTYVYRIKNLLKYSDTYTKIGWRSFEFAIVVLLILFILEHSIFSEKKDNNNKAKEKIKKL